LPPFAYGAGLNLFSNALTGFFMRNLGAFTVDRKKSDPLYLAAVKEYAAVLLEHGQHLLFFPGGTRSRSGALESELKLGFLSRVVAAFEERRQHEPNSPPLFVVPCTLSYPLVLEAATLIDGYLSAEGGPYFVDVRDEFERPGSWLDFLGGLAELDVQVHVRFGTPLDPIGNRVDATGVSRDSAGRALDPARYFQVDGAVLHDEARDSEYTKLLAQAVLSAYRRDSVVLPSSVLAAALFACLRRRHPRLDLFRLLRVLGPHATVTLAELEPQIDLVLQALDVAARRGELVLSPELARTGKRCVLEQGVATLCAYHREPVLRRHADTLEVMQPKLLLYYQNRLRDFDLPDTRTPSSRRKTSWSTP
jgi:glycerol-3-phosphate O-acyltransferase